LVEPTRIDERWALREFREASFPKGNVARGNARRSGCRKWAPLTIDAVRLRELGAEVAVAYNEPNGININDGCGSMHPEEIQRVSKSAAPTLH